MDGGGGPLLSVTVPDAGSTYSASKPVAVELAITELNASATTLDIVGTALLSVGCAPLRKLLSKSVWLPMHMPWTGLSAQLSSNPSAASSTETVVVRPRATLKRGFEERPVVMVNGEAPKHSWKHVLHAPATLESLRLLQLFEPPRPFTDTPLADRRIDVGAPLTPLTAAVAFGTATESNHLPALMSTLAQELVPSSGKSSPVTVRSS
mmetsp:Transcript_38049/g.117565  ORF Transcript_38049/g.117565 Transcript_38049/m.117565 type:complete len:208 (-) Transcript_38049:113-736(-)